MRSCLFHPCRPFPLVRIAFIAALTLLISGWSTCTAMVDFHSCEGSMLQPQITSLSPGAVAGDSTSVLLTQQTFESFGGAVGSSVQISVRSLGSGGVSGCTNGGNSATLDLVIN